MAIPQRRSEPPGRRGTTGDKGTAELLDRLVKQGRITAGQAAQYRVWESARPPIDGGRERFDAWMASRPNLPGVPPVGRATGAPGKISWQEMDRPVLTPRKESRAKPFPSQKAVLETVDRYERENKITEAQAELVRRWERKRPGTATGQDSFDTWMKARPDVPGLSGFWAEKT